jgi:hypothetical protein
MRQPRNLEAKWVIRKNLSMNSFSQKENLDKKIDSDRFRERPLKVGRPEPGAVANLPRLGASAAVTQRAGAKRRRRAFAP